MLRSTAPLLVIVMLAASGRLLACGWECLDELAAPAEAACHQESAPATALNDDGMHACLPEVAEPIVMVARPDAGQSVLALPLVSILNTLDQPSAWSSLRLSPQLRFEPPHSPAPSVLRI